MINSQILRTRFLIPLLALLLASGAATARAQKSPTQPAPATQQQAQHQTQAYGLPPAILAKAITLTRLRTLLAFGGTAWMILVLLVVLALRWPAALRNWAERITPSKWRQGLLFLPPAIIFISLIPLPLAIFGQHIERAYGLSVQSWPSWTLDQLKGLGLSILVYTPILMLLFRIIRVSPRPASSPSLSSRSSSRPFGLIPSSTIFHRSRKAIPCSPRNWSNWRTTSTSTFPPRACSS